MKPETQGLIWMTAMVVILLVTAWVIAGLQKGMV